MFMQHQIKTSNAYFLATLYTVYLFLRFTWTIIYIQMGLQLAKGNLIITRNFLWQGHACCTAFLACTVT